MRKKRKQTIQIAYLKEAAVALCCVLLLIIPFVSCKNREENEADSSKKESSVKEKIQERIKKPDGDIEIEVYNTEQKEMQTMELEDYLVGVVSAEMPASYSDEALKAQAVAARTYTIRKMHEETCSGGYDVCTDYHCCQAYNDEQQRKDKWSGGYEEYETKIENAVYGTAGEIMTYEGEPINALFHSTSGGQTEDAQAVFGGNALPYLKSVESEGEEDASRYTRTVSITKSDFVAGIKKIAPSSSVTKDNLAACIKEAQRTSSGRVQKIEIGGVMIGGRDIRTAFKLDSTNFTIELNGSNVDITTYGYGHGVGMSQAGANAMAKQDYAYDEILMHYYTGVELENLSNY